MASDIRRQPGFACQECRRRKARCDRVRPQCGTCAEAGLSCVIIEERPQRGPKKGQLKALRSRVGESRVPVMYYAPFYWPAQMLVRLLCLVMVHDASQIHMEDVVALNAYM